MLKLVHIADLHAGKVNGKTLDRNEDLIHSLEQVYGFLKEERAEYLIVAGDIFDKPRPDNLSSRIIGDFFVRVAELGTKVIAIAGNHDGSGFLDMFTPWSARWNIRIFPRLNTREFIFRDGDAAFVLVPFISERALTELSEGVAEAKVSYAEQIRKLLTYAAERVKDSPYRILVAHLFFAKSKIGRTERELTVSDIYAVDQAAIPETFQYAALGHVHRHQRLEWAKTDAFYSGSLYQLDFGEEGQEKFFNFVVIEDNRTEVHPVKLSLKRELRKISLKKEDDERKILSALKKTNLFLWVEIEAETPQEFSLKRSNAERILGENLLKVSVKWKRTFSGLPSKKGTPERSSDLRDPIKMYREYYLSMGKKPNRETERLLKELLQRLEV